MNEWRFPIVPSPSRGKMARGCVDWQDPVLVGLEWPYVAFRGADHGPALLVTAGVHGSEYSAIDAAIRLGAGLDAALLRGQVLILPLLNPAAFHGRTAYVCPIDGLNLNRVFPGRVDGSFSERLAFNVSDRLIRRADAFIDMHGGDIPEALVPFTIWPRSGDAGLDARTAALAAAFGQPIVLASDTASAPIAGPTISAGAQYGVPSLIVEDGGAGRLDPASSDRLVDGVRRVLRALGMVADEGAGEPPTPQRTLDRFLWVRAGRAGFFRPAVAVGNAVAAGAPLGTVVDMFGAVLDEPRAPADGIVLFLVVSAAMAADGLVCGIGAAA